MELREKFAILQDTGKHYVITDVVELEPSKVIGIESEILHPITDLAAFTVNQAAGTNKILGVHKTIGLRNKIEITDLLDISVFNSDPLMSMKQEFIRKVYEKLVVNFNDETRMALYTFQILNTKFASEGIFITSENKQEIYIQIIEKDDEELLDDLEEYLDAKSKLDEIYRIYKLTKHFKERLTYASSEDEIREIYDEFKTAV